MRRNSSAMEHLGKAAYLVRHGASDTAFEWRERKVGPPKSSEVKIEVQAFGLNFADVLARNGLYREAPPLPAVLGYDIVGRVIETGADVDPIWIGKRVVALTRFGGYATHVCTPLIGVAEVPEDMPEHAACALGTQYATALYASNFLQQVRSGENVLIHAAAGGVGTALVQLLKHKQCTLFATAGSDEKVSALNAEGIIAFNYNTQDYEKEIKNLLGDKKLDVSFNSIAGSTFKKDMRLLGANGRLVLYGFAERSGKSGGIFATMSLLWKMGILLPIFLLAKSKSILGVNMLKIADQKPQIIKSCLEELVMLWKDGKIHPINGGSYSQEDLPKAHAALEQRKSTGKIIVKIR